MRRNLLALGVLLVFLGLFFLSVSRTVMKPELSWAIVENTRANKSTEKLSLQGYLTKGDRFQVTFGIDQNSSSPFFLEPGVYVNVTDPNGYSSFYNIDLTTDEYGYVLRLDPWPEDVANYTGSYTVAAEAFDILLKSLVLHRQVKTEPGYPYSFLFPVGIGILLGGGGISLFGVKISKPKRIRYKRRLHEHTKRFVDMMSPPESMFPIESL